VFTITEKAAERALFFMAEEGRQGWGVRIYMADGAAPGMDYGIDPRENPEEGDVVFERDGLRVFVDKRCVEFLENKQLDYYEKDDEVGFLLNCVRKA
jgi:iron-sulfur cluster assembly accessory protein